MASALTGGSVAVRGLGGSIGAHDASPRGLQLRGQSRQQIQFYGGCRPGHSCRQIGREPARSPRPEFHARGRLPQTRPPCYCGQIPRSRELPGRKIGKALRSPTARSCSLPGKDVIYSSCPRLGTETAPERGGLVPTCSSKNDITLTEGVVIVPNSSPTRSP